MVLPPHIFAQTLSAIGKTCASVPFAEHPSCHGQPLSSEPSWLVLVTGHTLLAPSMDFISPLSNAHNSLQVTLHVSLLDMGNLLSEFPIYL